MVAITIAIAAALYFYINGSFTSYQQSSIFDKLSNNNWQQKDGSGQNGGDSALGSEKKATPDNPPEIKTLQIIRTNILNTGFIKDSDTIQITAVVEDENLPTLTITADLSQLLKNGGTEVPPTTFSEGQATWILENIGLTTPDGSKTVTITASDEFNSKGTNTATVIVDNTKPAPITGFSATPGHNKIKLKWTTPTEDPDTEAYGILIRRVSWGNYPEYPGSGPTYPANNEGTPAYSASGILTDSYTDQFNTNGLQRDIYYYQAFLYDKAYNYGPADSGAHARSTNYWLGDVAPYNPNTGAIGDGYVNQDDMTVLSASYFTHAGGPGFNPLCDIGPESQSPAIGRGIPMPDKSIDFHDLVPFSFNYGVVNPDM